MPQQETASLIIDPSTARVDVVHLPERLEVEGVFPAEDLSLIVVEQDGEEFAQVGIHNPTTNEHRSFVPISHVIYEASRDGRSIAVDPAKKPKDPPKILEGQIGEWIPKKRITQGLISPNKFR